MMSSDDNRFVVRDEERRRQASDNVELEDTSTRTKHPYGFGIDDEDAQQGSMPDDVDSFAIVPRERKAKSDIPWLYHNIYEDVPESKRINAEWALLAHVSTAALALMNICISVVNIVDIGGATFNLARGLAMAELVCSTFIFLGYVVVGFLFLYWQMYNAFRTSNSLRYLFAFNAGMVNIVFCGIMVVGIPGINPGLFSAITMAIAGTAWFSLFMQFMCGLIWMACGLFHGLVLHFMMKKMHREGRSLRKGLQQFRQWSVQWRDRYSIKQALIGSYA